MAAVKPSHTIKLDLAEIAPKALWFNVGLVLLFAAAYHLFAEPLSFRFSVSGIALFLAGYAGLVVLHEAFHLIGFVLFGGVPLSSLKYGVNFKMGIAYATTSTAIRTGAMKKALLLPFWTTGVIPVIIGFWIESQVLVLLGAMLIAAAIGDFYMYRALLKEQRSAWVLDDPELPHLHIYDSMPKSGSTD